MSIIVLYNERVCSKLSTFISFSFLLFLLRVLCYQSFHSSYQPSLLLSAFRPASSPPEPFPMLGVGEGLFSRLSSLCMSVNSCDTDFEHVNAIIACYWGQTVLLLYYIHIYLQWHTISAGDYKSWAANLRDDPQKSALKCSLL